MSATSSCVCLRRLCILSDLLNPTYSHFFASFASVYEQFQPTPLQYIYIYMLRRIRWIPRRPERYNNITNGSREVRPPRSRNQRRRSQATQALKVFLVFRRVRGRARGVYRFVNEGGGLPRVTTLPTV